jgi:GNAT superfamily N-acetyltransferase
MKWPTTDELRAQVQLPEGYQFERLDRTHIAPLIASIKLWYPDISAGANSGYLREDYYQNRIYFEGEVDRDIWVSLIMFKGELVGVWSVEREVDSLALYGRLIIVAPAHRGANLIEFVIHAAEFTGRSMGAAFLYVMATLKIPHAQRALEAAGYQLLGFFPGYDREEVSPGVVKRVYQAVYAKLLVPPEEVLFPDPKNMTPKTKALFELLFGDAPDAIP